MCSLCCIHAHKCVLYHIYVYCTTPTLGDNRLDIVEEGRVQLSPEDAEERKAHPAQVRGEVVALDRTVEGGAAAEGRVQLGVLVLQAHVQQDRPAREAGSMN